MGFIKLTDNSTLAIDSKLVTPTLTHYLQAGAVFVFSKLSPEFKRAQNKRMSEVDAGAFPIDLSINTPTSFAIAASTLQISPTNSASIDVLKADKKEDFAKKLDLLPAQVADLLSFRFTGQLQSGPSGTVGDFCFGLLSDREISVTNYCPAAQNELLFDTLQNAISGVTLPHDLDDLRSIPTGNVCQIAGTGGLKFTAAVQYSFLNNPLATAPFDVFSNALTLKLQSGVKFQVALEHSSTHQLTIAALGSNKIRLAASLAREASTEEALDFSIGVSANIGSTDALPFLIQQISATPDKDLQQIRALLSTGEQSDLSSQIKGVVQAATKGGLNATLHDALKQSRERNHLFVYEIDLSGLDSMSASAVEAALLGTSLRSLR